MALVLGLWFLLQAYLLWKSGCGGDRDLLDYMAHGCASCKGAGACGRKLKEHHHELI
jgi:hypothetical protein